MRLSPNYCGDLFVFVLVFLKKFSFNTIHMTVIIAEKQKALSKQTDQWCVSWSSVSFFPVFNRPDFFIDPRGRPVFGL